MQDALAFENPSTSCSFLPAAEMIGHPKLFTSPADCRAKAQPFTALCYFEYNSTINCSLNAGVCTSSRFGMATTLALNCSRSNSSHGTVFWLCATLRASITMAFWCILSLMDTSSPTFTKYDG